MSARDLRKHFPSISFQQSDILYSIQQLHLNGKPFDLDPAFNQGAMWSGLQVPCIQMDISPITPACIQGDYTKMPFDADVFNSIAVDPPFVIGKSGRMVSKYSGFNTLAELQYNYISLCSECTRCIKRDGILVIKCQDVIHDRRRYFTSYFLQNVLFGLGWNQVDEYILNSTKRMHSEAHTGNNLSRSYHCKFMVFRFRKGRRKYTGLSHS